MQTLVDNQKLRKTTFCKVLIRYNPEGNKALNVCQSARLRRLSDYLHDKSQSRFMFELTVPPVKVQIERVNGDKRAYDLESKPQRMIHAIEQLQNAQVEPLGRGEDDLKGARMADNVCRSARIHPSLAWDLVQTFLAAEFTQAERHLRRLGKVASLKQQGGRREYRTVS